MNPDYKNWIPKGMLYSLIAGTALSLALLVFGVFGIGVSGNRRIRHCWIET
ncbi:MAG: hypothetical protein PUI35_03760 [Oscillibacter sp.]|nr:hypothetical protein [Oscillibacter sp.]